MKENSISEKKIRNKTVIAFLIFFLAFGTGVFAWIYVRKQPLDSGMSGGIPAPLRKGLNANDQLFTAVFNPDRLVKTYPKSEAAKKVRVNGDVGMSDDFDAAAWHLAVVRKSGDTAFFTMEDIKRIPKSEVVYDFKCIEGWSQRTWWGGVKFSDFINYYHLGNEAQSTYVGMITPDQEYYVGIDMMSALHPQTLLAYEMNGQSLPMDQGYPLRLIIPVKYGIKSIKRIGTIFFSDQRPKDYWAERGYDYYAGH